MSNQDQVLSMLDVKMDSDLNLNKAEAVNYLQEIDTTTSKGEQLDFKTTAATFDWDSGTKTLENNTTLSGWSWWRDYYYPYVVRESYPVYIRERAEDRGKQAFEIAKTLNDKKLLNIKDVKDFVTVMDEIIKIL